ncbi:MAG TPA: ATP-dependent helicase [Syntrophorhabdaceae bacterium]|nr:ATP-dependent helicase [Syntrophorhabdaceae bacterium]
MKKYIIQKDIATTTSHIEYEKELNEEQLRVVLHDDGPILVIAGAGSGKTRVVTYRVARLLERGISPHSILLLTFTNKAAREMLRRVEHLLKIDTRFIWGGTFHHIGNIILRQNSHLIGFNKNFTILDNEDAKDMIDVVIKDAKIDKKANRFPKASLIKEIFSYAVNTMNNMDTVILERFPFFFGIRDELSHIQKLYTEKKKAANAMDFDDLLFYWHKLLMENKDLREYYARVFSHILVDEYQDTNRIQAEIVDFMGLINRNVMVVGDDAQSIYSFRGANFKNIMDFPVKYPETKIFKLETNYRSTPEILKLANNSISKNKTQFTKNLRSIKQSGNIPVLTHLRDVMQQADFVAQRILELRDDGIPLEQMAVLYRAHYHSMELQMELTRRDIPFEIRSGLRFFEQAHIKDVVSFLRIMVNNKDEISWKRMLKLFPRIGKRTSDHIFDYIKTLEDPVGVFISKKIGEHFKNIHKENIEIWARLFKELLFFYEKEALGDMISCVLKNGYTEYLKYNYPNFEARLEDLGQLINFSSKYVSLETFLNELSLMGGISGEEIISADREDERVILSTIHQAKGLEWKVVFLIWCADGRFPNPKAVEEGNIEEERRLFYVAVTRAMDELYMCYPLITFDKQAGHIILKPSRFISELRGSTYDEWQVSDTDYRR